MHTLDVVNGKWLKNTKYAQELLLCRSRASHLNLLHSSHLLSLFGKRRTIFSFCWDGLTNSYKIFLGCKQDRIEYSPKISLAYPISYIRVKRTFLSLFLDSSYFFYFSYISHPSSHYSSSTPYPLPSIAHEGLGTNQEVIAPSQINLLGYRVELDSNNLSSCYHQT